MSCKVIKIKKRAQGIAKEYEEMKFSLDEVKSSLKDGK